MKKMYALLAILLMVVFCLSGCNKVDFDDDEIVGLTSSQIIEKYGDFDRKQGSIESDGLYHDCACGYLVSKEKKDFLGTTPPKYYMIYFDNDGIAYLCRYEEVV